MHEIRNVLYHIKKDSTKRSSPLYQPDPERDNLREELSKIRTQLRSKDTEIIRLHTQIEELRNRIVMFEVNSKLASQGEEESQEKQVQAFSGIPMIFENKELKESNECLHRQNLQLNGRNNELEAALRQSNSDNKRLQLRLKQLEILEKMREERFKDQLQRIPPIIVEENKDFSYIREGVTKITEFLREHTFTVLFEMFLKCAKDCQREKKVSSFSIFKNYWSELKNNKGFGLLAAVKGYESMRKLAQTLDQEYCQLNEGGRDTMNEWVLNTIVQIRHSNFPKEKQQKLFRLLSLYYRSKFPIKGQHFTLDPDLKTYFQDLICREMSLQLLS